MFWSEVIEVYGREELLLWVTVCAAGLMMAAACVAYALKNTGVFTAFVAMIGGVMILWGSFAELDKRARFTLTATLLIFGGVIYLILFGALTVRKVITERKKRRAEIARRLCYTLPARENSYIRTRLNTTLQVPEEPLNAYLGGSEGDGKPMKLEYVRQLLNKVKSAALTKAERLQLEEMERAFALYLHKESWTAGDLRAMNELCASLLKLSAKYSV